MRRNSIRTISVFLLILLMSTLFVFSTITATAARRIPSSDKIRVAQPNLSNFYDSDKFGSEGGYGYEYLNQISLYTDWEYEFRSVTPEEGYEMLASGEADLFGPVAKNPDLQRDFDFSAVEVGLSYSLLCAKTDNNEIAFQDFSAFDGIRVGLIQGASINDSLNQYSHDNQFEYDSVYYQTQDSLLNSLNNGIVDAILVSSLDVKPSDRVLAKFAPTPYYFITAKGNEDILTPLNDALAKIKYNNPYFDYELQEKYYSFDSSQVLVLTQEEKEYIKNIGELKATYDPDWSPFEYYDSASDSFSGINADIFRLISDTTGLQFSYENSSSYDEALKKLNNHSVDILVSMDNNPNWAAKHNAVISDSFLITSIILVKNINRDNVENPTIALPKGYMADSEYAKVFSPDSEIIYYNSPEECFVAVNKGIADMTYANSYVTEKLFKNAAFNNLEIIETVNLTDQLCIGISNAADPLLVSIINKAIHSISSNQLNHIIFLHTVNEKQDINLLYLLYKKPEYIVALLTLFFFLTTATLLIIIKVKNHLNSEMAKVAYLDSVTGTGNYHQFKKEAEVLLKTSKTTQYAIAYLDIYKFSYVNDTFGYEVGDLVLAKIAEVMESILRDTERCARISADNFVYLIEYENDAEIISRGLDFQSKCDVRLHQFNSRLRIQLTGSVYKVAPGESDIPSLVGKADIAHKTLGDIHRATIVFYDDKIEKDFLQKKKLESAMTSALSHEEYQIFLQPKIDLQSNHIVGTEALTRWQHPTEGFVFPDQFIPLFESNGFILELDFYIFEKVCLLLRKWINTEQTVLPISVNVSKAHLSDRRFASQLKALLDRYEIPPELFELELTENIFLEDSQEEAISMIKELKSLGFTILIDDFGSGYSSLNLLKDLIVDVLKLDKAFFRKGTMEEKDKIIVGGIINIANDLKLRIISEGVETQEQVDFLVAAGCHMAQGYFFAKPMPIDDFESLMNYRI